MQYLDRNKTALVPDPIAIHGERDDVTIDVALEWNDSYYEKCAVFLLTISRSAMEAPIWRLSARLLRGR